jgi:hypothetical protein
MILSAFDLKEEFTAFELAWVLDECLPRLEEDGNCNAVPLEILKSFRQSLDTKLRQQQTLASRGNNAVGNESSSIAAILADYVSRAYLEKSWSLGQQGTPTP